MKTQYPVPVFWSIIQFASRCTASGFTVDVVGGGVVVVVVVVTVVVVVVEAVVDVVVTVVVVVVDIAVVVVAVLVVDVDELDTVVVVVIVNVAAACPDVDRFPASLPEASGLVKLTSPGEQIKPVITE